MCRKSTKNSNVCHSFNITAHTSSKISKYASLTAINILSITVNITIKNLFWGDILGQPI